MPLNPVSRAASARLFRIYSAREQIGFLDFSHHPKALFRLMDRQKTAIVVGAGVGGVATAARLALAGFQVTVVEKNDFTGGRCSLLERNGYRFDQGPSLVLLPRMFEETFSDLGTSLEAEGVHLVQCNPNYRILFGDGEDFTMTTDLARMKREIERYEGERGFERFVLVPCPSILSFDRCL